LKTYIREKLENGKVIWTMNIAETRLFNDLSTFWDYFCDF
jgi:hypothetical protein